MSARVAVIGARRRRQGIGQFVARWLHAAGAEVRAVVGTTPESAAEAAETLRESRGIEARPHVSVRGCLAEEDLDAVAICSPFVFHREQIETAAAAGVHVLCEKPMWWGGPEEDWAAETARLVDLVRERGRVFGLVTQWPNTLPGFFELFPERGVPESFGMDLCPGEPGGRMIPDAMPHPLSMLAALCGPGTVVDPELEFSGDGTMLLARFGWRHGAGTTAVTVRLTVKERPPRPASYSIDGRTVDREIVLPEYTMALVAEGRRLPIPDPLEARVREFLAEADRGAAASASSDRECLVAGMAGLQVLTRAAERCNKSRFRPPEPRKP